MSRRTTLLLRRELAGAIRARWFLVYSAVFLLGGVLLTAFGGADTALYGYRGLAKAFGGLVHLALLFVPLMALFPATAAIAEERESGALEYTLAQPVTFGEVYLGKWAGVSLALLLSLIIGFGVAGAVGAGRGVPVMLLLELFGFVVLLGLAFVGIGLALSVTAGSRARATTAAVVLWLGLVTLGTLGIIAAFLLGPVGARIVDAIGVGGARAAAAGSLCVWAIAPALFGWMRFRRQG
jgi:ABC-type transport system involved in multi-copper enzyme maturation permease subunit